MKKIDRLKERKKQSNNQWITIHRSKRFRISNRTILILIVILFLSKNELRERFTNNNIYKNNQLLISAEEKNELLQLLEENGIINTITNDNFLILNAVIENPNLTAEEKTFLYQFQDLLEENPYLNKEKVYEALRNVDIIYSQREKNLNEEVVGIYILQNNQIKIFSDNKKKETIIHELIHCIYTNNNTNEYFSEQPFIEETSYPFEIAMIKILCNMVGSDNFLYYYSTGDITPIKKELEKSFSKKDTNIFLKKIENLFIDFETEKRVKEDDLKQILKITDNFFLKKIQENESLYEEYIYYRGELECMTQEEPYLRHLFYQATEECINKAFFSRKLKKKYQNSTLAKEKNMVYRK